jgi:hypothetical protein
MSGDGEVSREASVRRVEIRRVGDASAAPTTDVVAAEEPFGIRLG